MPKFSRVAANPCIYLHPQPTNKLKKKNESKEKKNNGDRNSKVKKNTCLWRRMIWKWSVVSSTISVKQWTCKPPAATSSCCAEDDGESSRLRFLGEPLNASKPKFIPLIINHSQYKLNLLIWISRRAPSDFRISNIREREMVATWGGSQIGKSTLSQLSLEVKLRVV